MKRRTVRCAGRMWGFDELCDDPGPGWYTIYTIGGLPPFNVSRVENAPYTKADEPVGRWAWWYRFDREIRCDGFKTMRSAMRAAVRAARRKQ